MPMLRSVTAGSGPRLGLLVRYTDGTREAAYDATLPSANWTRRSIPQPATAGR
jgi:hypothetical protein